MTSRASVIIPTRNGMPLVERCLREVFAQSTPWPFEVIAIDSGSTDGTWELLGSLPVTRRRIAPVEFNHGRTRNLAAAMASGQFLVFTVQDAVPADRRWLQSLVAAAEAPDVAGAYSRQLPWPSDSPITRYQLVETLRQPAHRFVQRLPVDRCWDSLSGRERFELSQFRNVASCMRSEICAGYPFAEVPYGEDLEWGQRVVRAGLALVYTPEAAVYHSHSRSCWYELKRAYADHELVTRLFGYRMLPCPARALLGWLRASLRVLRYLARQPEPAAKRISPALRAPMLLAAQHVGAYLGSQAALRGDSTLVWRRVDAVMRESV